MNNEYYQHVTIIYLHNNNFDNVLLNNLNNYPIRSTKKKKKTYRYDNYCELLITRK